MPILEAPDDGVTVRMYRQGHGDCYLLSMPNKDDGGEPVHVLIDCGYKPGSQNYIDPPRDTRDILQHIQDSTDKKIDLVIATHEHQDHLNLFTKKRSNGSRYFEEVEINNAWFAWTEDPRDRLAKKLRKRHGDQLLQLANARNQLVGLAVDGELDPTVRQIDALLELEMGGETGKFDIKDVRGFAADSEGAPRSENKIAMKLLKDAAGSNIEYLKPGQSLLVPGTEVRAYVLGPPRRESLLTDEDPREDEEFPRHHLDSYGLSFGAAASKSDKLTAPFSVDYRIGKRTALTKKYLGGHFLEHYGKSKSDEKPEKDSEVSNDADWRRIDSDWLHSAGSLALKLNRGVNNTSLVLAFELPKSKRVLLFVGDAQRGSWVSWDDKPCKVGDKTVTARDLLGRTVLYKVGHHCSHNATLKGDVESDYPNLSWMGASQYGDEFVAMINAVNKWAMTKNNPPWRHPLPSIAAALHEKAKGRVFQTDKKPRKPQGDALVSTSEWNSFKSRCKLANLYFDYTVKDD